MTFLLWVDSKRVALIGCFLLDTRRALLDNLVALHDHYIMGLCRQSRNKHEKDHRNFRKRQKKAVDIMLFVGQILLQHPENELLDLQEFFERVTKKSLNLSIQDLKKFKEIDEKGYGGILLSRYSSLRRYFPSFISLPFAAHKGSEQLMKSIEILRSLNSSRARNLPEGTPTCFVPKELKQLLVDERGKIRKSTWEMSLALAIREALRSGDIYIPQSKHHVSFWELILKEDQWEAERLTAYEELYQSNSCEIKQNLVINFEETVASTSTQFRKNGFAQIINGKLKLKKEDKTDISQEVLNLQKTVESCLPTIRIEHLLMEVDQHIHFSRHFTPIHRSRSEPKQFYKTLIAAIISQATNLGTTAMSASVRGISVDMLRHVLN